MREQYVYAADGTTVNESYIYDATGTITSQTVNGDISEFDGTGRVVVFYDSANTEYNTYTWGAVQVTVNAYDGTYVPATGAVTSERTHQFVYDHKNEQTNLDADPVSGTYNGWIMREQYVYAADGTTVDELYEYNAAGTIFRQTVSGDISEFDTSNGRVVVYYDSTETEYKTWTWGATQVTVDVYDAIYNPAVGPITVARTERYVYDHNNEFTNLDADPASGTYNGWLLTSKLGYAADGTTAVLTENYYGSGLIQDKTYASSGANPDGDDLYYEYENNDFYSNGVYGRLIRSQASDGTVYKTVSFWGATDTAKKKEQYTNLAETTWQGTGWYYQTSGRMSKKLQSTGEAATYFDAGQTGPGDYYEQTYWPAGWATPQYYYTNLTERLATRKAWYHNVGAVPPVIEVYTYYGNGVMQYKDEYTGTWGSWTWYRTASWTSTGAWSQWMASAQAAAPALITKPAATDTQSLDNVDVMVDMPLSEEVEAFMSRVEDLKARATGEGVTIAILDTGVNEDELDANIIGGHDFTDDTASYTDEAGHGTLTAGVVADTATGSAIYAAKVFDEDGETDTAIVADAIKSVIDAGARVLAMPFSLFPISTQLDDAIAYALDRGAIIVTAAGNSGTDVLDDSLASYDNIITVGAVDNDGTLSAWSNRGDHVDIFAPWDVEIAASPSAPRNDGGEAGTSFSTAFVAGITALILSEDPDLTFTEVFERLQDMTQDLGELKEEEPAAVNNAVNQALLGELMSRQAAHEKSSQQAEASGRKRSDFSLDIEKKGLMFNLKGPR